MERGRERERELHVSDENARLHTAISYKENKANLSLPIVASNSVPVV